MDDWRKSLEETPEDIGAIIFSRWPDLTSACSRYLRLLSVYANITPELKHVFIEERDGLLDTLQGFVSVRTRVASRFEARVKSELKAWYDDKEMEK